MCPLYFHLDYIKVLIGLQVLECLKLDLKSCKLNLQLATSQPALVAFKNEANVTAASELSNSFWYVSLSPVCALLILAPALHGQAYRLQQRFALFCRRSARCGTRSATYTLALPALPAADWRFGAK